MSDLTISRVETRLLDVPLIRPHGFATYTATAQPILLISVHLEGGVVGYGEGVVPGGAWWGGEAAETMKIIIDRELTPVTVGKEVTALTGIVKDWNRSVANMRFAKAGLEIAMYDAWARALDVPLAHLLGGKFRDELDCVWALGVLPLDEAISEVNERIETMGTRSFKLKMGSGDPRVDTRRISELIANTSDELSYRIDINARWDRLTALTWLPKLAEAGIELFEQPTPADDLDTLREITTRIGVPVMVDESVCSPADALNVVRKQAADVVAIKTTKLGGLEESKKTAAIAEAAGLACHGATSLEGPFGTAASLHFAASTPAVTYGTELFGPLLLKESYAQEEIVYRDGKVVVPEGPGSGMNPDWDKINHFTRE
ncbi:chloromuconate cycloisomerase [Corynebacterium yudongzhengii]|uniref:Chloromuconate cycloisomerase n=1 Tax=Corynebacterium yudongzhengii TaxID=2080740 RepID=A0A2U1T8W2_9CORY|nr:muconate/chloromuconate family cycloisomerase [Corynebacterium yudongzhengii]AWB82497.1 chloromuconate cycloisomerase [Corynebacterium yudongzhengii]PWC02447.1 chloromuconate cycloisomerase [Corynebacterium yudongzhengii]